MSGAPDLSSIPGMDSIKTSSTNHGEAAPAVVETPAAATGAPGAETAPPATGEQAPVTGEQSPPTGDAATADEDGKGKDRLQVRFSELTGQRDAEKARAEAARTEADYWKQRALEGAPAPAKTAETAPAASDGPDPAKYEQGEFDPQFIKDTIDHRVSAAVKTALTENQQDQQRRSADQEFTTKAVGLHGKLVASGLEGAVQFAEGGKIPTTRNMIELLASSEHAVAVADHLGKNPQEAERIAKLSPSMQGYELARLEGRLAAPPKTTSAPGPTPTVTGLSPASDDFSPDMSQGDFEKLIERKHGGFVRP
jgi:hypothetical protein